MPTIALISDIHGNLPALEAVMADIGRRGADTVCVAGDLVNGCPWPAEVTGIVRAKAWPAVLGNHDDAVLQLETRRMEGRYGHQERYGALWWKGGQLADPE